MRPLSLAAMLIAVWPTAPPPQADLARLVATERAFSAGADEPQAAGARRDVDGVRGQDIGLVEARFAEAPFAGADAAAAFMGSTFDRVAWAVLASDVARSGDMAVTTGAYDAAASASEGRPSSPERGFFVRVWHRDAGGQWKIAFETNGIR